jgi:hypothetical protein
MHDHCHDSFCCWHNAMRHTVSVSIVWDHPLEDHVPSSLLQRTVCVHMTSVRPHTPSLVFPSALCSDFSTENAAESAGNHGIYVFGYIIYCPSSMEQSFPEEMIVAQLANTELKLHYFLNCLKCTKTLMILKTDKHKNNTNIYRPVSLYGAYTCTCNINTTRKIHLLYQWGYAVACVCNITEQKSHGNNTVMCRVIRVTKMAGSSSDDRIY